MSDYSRWLQNSIETIVAESPSLELPDEITLQSLWLQGAFGLEFTTTENDPVRILFMGEWNRAAGPDFLECIVEINGIQNVGAIELDISAKHWESHGHSTNPNFDQVILHVSFIELSDEAYCRTSKNQNVPRVVISPDKIAAGLSEYHTRTHQDEPLAIPGYCAESFATWGVDDINDLLKTASHHRMAKKGRTFQSLITAVGLEEAIWQAFAVTLGYRPNQDAMRRLAQRLNIKALRQLDSDDFREAALYGTSGFLSPELYHNAPAENKQYLASLWNNWWKLRNKFELAEERAITWNYAGIRPVNHPHRRVAALAQLLPLIAKVKAVLQQPNATAIEELSSKIQSLADEHWSHHYTLGSKRTERTLSLFGNDKIKEFLNNFLIPYWFTRDQEAAFGYSSTTKAPSPNSQVKKALNRLFPSHSHTKEISSYTWQHQGLQQLYRDFCLHSGCLKCPLPSQLKLKRTHHD